MFCSTFNNFCIVGLNIMKPPWCTPTHKGFLTTENTIDHAIWEISTWQTKKQRKYLTLRSIFTLTKWIIFIKHYWIFHDLLWYRCMNSEIIQSVAYDNYDDFQHVNFIFSQKNSFHYFKDYCYNLLFLSLFLLM
jgi:hypothetical protein